MAASANNVGVQSLLLEQVGIIHTVVLSLKRFETDKGVAVPIGALEAVEDKIKDAAARITQANSNSN